MIGYKIEENVLRDLELLRKEGLSLKSIALKLGISKATVSKYCKDIELSEEASNKLKSNVIENGKKQLLLAKNKIKADKVILFEQAKNKFDLNQDKNVLIKELIDFGLARHQIASLLCITFGSVNYKSFNSSYRQRKIEQISEQRRKIKRKLIDYSGGKCVKCGYSKCNSALAFHHINPNEKEFAVGCGVTVSYDTHKLECDKCLVLCHNCHSEFHDGLWKISNEMIMYQNEVRLKYINKPLVDYKDLVTS